MSTISINIEFSIVSFTKQHISYLNKFQLVRFFAAVPRVKDKSISQNELFGNNVY